MQRSKAPTDAWREYSAINVAFARELDLTPQMVQQGHDPTFSPKRDAVEARLSLIKPGRASSGHMWLEIGAAHGLEVRDPTCDPRVMSFCWSIPESQYVRDGHNRMLIRRAMAGYLPERVRWNRRIGVQSADLGQRILDHRSGMATALARLERSELARHYLDLPKMRGVFESLQHRIDRENNAQSGMVLLRGLMVGLFLLRFET
jgi:asparagine synthase (glutamine-hydrolysing)